jgi:type I site-specific restriction endonuclease
MFGVYFTGFIRNNILSEGKMKKLFITISNNVITIDSFFLIELREILLEIMEKQDKYTYSVNVKTIKNLIKELETNTWLNNDTEHVFKLDRQRMKDVLDVNPKEFQEPVYDQYEYKKNVLKNKGLLLDMGTGTGKTYTSIS